MQILLTGGAGYIGSHIVKKLIENTNHIIYIFDNLSTGTQKIVNSLYKIAESHHKSKNLIFIKEDLKNIEKINTIFGKCKFDIIIHLAASISVPESISNPLKYYSNNTMNTDNLLKCALANNINKIIFSSTAAVYGIPTNMTIKGIDEESETNPINPYGMSKLMSEISIKNTANANKKFKYIIFRYFNVAGADMNFENNRLLPRIGQSNVKAKHLIKIASECAIGIKEGISIYGNNFNTFDGTAIRDFIHVDDLADAHLKAIEYLNENKDSEIFNIGYNKGYSVKEVINTVKKISNTDFLVNIEDKRIGDLEQLISNNNKISKYLNWIPKYDNLELICKSNIAWELIMNNNKIYIVNLEFDKKRKKHMTKICDELNLNYEFTDAVYGKKLENIDTYIQHSKNTVTQGLKRELTTGEIGCILSHQNIYKRIIENNLEYALILEDDIDISNDMQLAFENINNLPNDWDIFFIGYHGKKHDDLLIKSNLTYKIDFNYSIYSPTEKVYGTYGYIVSLKGAKKLLNMSSKYELPIDWYTGSLNLNSYILSNQMIFINDELSKESNLIKERIQMRIKYNTLSK